jgi:hypothetical protein
MKLPYSIRQRRQGGNWHVRGTWRGVAFEFSTEHKVEAVAWAFAAELWEDFESDATLNADDPRAPEITEATPEAIPLGLFEMHLLANYTLVGESVVQLGSGRTLAFHSCNGGYRQAVVMWERREKRVLEHRMKFLLHHRWLPRSVDHINRRRSDNALANLRASTPRLQSANRGVLRRANLEKDN